MVEYFNLEFLTSNLENAKEITTEEIHRPGLEMSGYFEISTQERVQLFGKQELFFLRSLSEDKMEKVLEEYFSKKPMAVIVSRGLETPECFITKADKYKVPVMRTDEVTTHFIAKLSNFLQKELAKEIGIHAVCVNVHGVGILIRGHSGIGKSEVALSLIERGHRLISDDLVILKKIGPRALIATSNKNNQDFLALRGVGLVNFPLVFGSGAFQQETKINLDILLSKWDESKYYDAMGQEEKKTNYLDIEIEHSEIPIRPGRDIAGLIEVAAKNWRLKQQGYSALDEFYQRLNTPFSEE